MWRKPIVPWSCSHPLCSVGSWLGQPSKGRSLCSSPGRAPTALVLQLAGAVGHHSHASWSSCSANSLRWWSDQQDAFLLRRFAFPVDTLFTERCKTRFYCSSLPGVNFCKMTLFLCNYTFPFPTSVFINFEIPFVESLESQTHRISEFGKDH